MKIQYLLLLLTLSFFTVLPAQDKHDLDSMLQLYEKLPNDKAKVKLLHQICQHVLYTKPNDAYKYAMEMISISEDIGFKNGIALGCYRAGGYFLNRHELDSAYFYHSKALEISKELKILISIINGNTELGIIHMRKNEFNRAFELFNLNIGLYENKDTIPYAKEDDFRYLGTTYQNLASLHTEKGNYNLALDNALLALEFYEKNGEALFIADGLNSLGVIEGQLENHEKSIEYLQKSYETYLKYEDQLFASLALNNIGLALVQLGRAEEAINYYLKAIDIAEENSFKKWQGNFLTNLGTALFELGDLDEALDRLNTSVEVLKETNHPSEIRTSYLNLGRVYNATKNPDKAIFYLDKSIELSDSLNSFNSASKAYLVRSESYSQLGRYELALNDYKKYSSLSDSIFNKTKSQQIEELRIIQEKENNEKEIALKKKEIILLEEKARANTLQRTLLAVGLIFVIIFFGLGIFGLKQKVKRNKLEKEKLDAELEFKKKELTTHALNLARKNEVLENLKAKAQELKQEQKGSLGYNELIRTINFDLRDDNNWENFASYFEQVHKDFNRNLKKKCPELTPNELRFMALLKMNLSSKEIANILNVTPDGVKKARYRLRKKLNIQTEDSLEEIAMSL